MFMIVAICMIVHMAQQCEAIILHYVEHKGVVIIFSGKETIFLLVFS